MSQSATIKNKIKKNGFTLVETLEKAAGMADKL